MSTNQTVSAILVSVLLGVGALATAGHAETLGYGGRILDDAGKPAAGPVHLEVRFFDHKTDGAALGPVLDKPGVTLTDGVFQIDLTLTSGETDAVFGSAGEVWIEIKDKDRGTAYPRQRFMAVPFALRVPVDGTTIDYDSLNALTIKAPASVDLFLKSTGTGGVAWASLPGGGDMLRSTYDPDLDGKVANADTAANALLLGGENKAFYQDASNLNAGTVGDAFIPAGIARDTEIPATTDALAEGASNKYFTNAAARGAVGATAPLAYVAGTGVFSLPQANGSTDGYLASGDWTTFNSKQAALTGTTDLAIDQFSATSVSIGTTAAGADLLFGSGANRTMQVQTQAAAGNSLTVQAGGTSGGNLNGGDLILASGTANGTGTSSIQLKTANGGAPATTMTLLGNGTVGIGTTAPGSLLNLVASSNSGSSASYPSIKVQNTLVAAGDGATTWNMADVAVQAGGSVDTRLMSRKDVPAIGLVGTNSAHSFSIVTGGVDNRRLTVDTSGNVGIGTTDPAAKLEIDAATTTVPGLVLKTTDDNATKNIFEVRNSSGSPIAWIDSQFGGINFSGLASIAASSTLRFATGTIGRAAVDSSGTFGIGDNVEPAGTAQLLVQAVNRTTVPTVVVKQATSQTADLMQWQNSGGTVLNAVAASGNVGIGTPTAGQKLEVNGSIKLTASSGGGIIFQDGTTQTTATNSAPAQMWVRVTRATVTSATADATKDSTCASEFGAAYSAATLVDFGANAQRQVYSTFYINFRGVAVAYNVSSGNLTAFIAGTYPLACVRAGAPLRLTSTTTATADADATKDAACVTDFGSSYQAVNTIDGSINWRGPYTPSVFFNVAGDAANYCYSNNTYVGIYCAFGTSTMPVLCAMK